MAATAGDQINRALRLIGELAEGEVPSAETSNDSLVTLGQMLDSWSTERLSVYALQDQTFTWPAGQTTRTLGPSGDFVGNRPVRVDDSSYFVDSAGTSFPLTLVNIDQYNSIAIKSTQSSYPQVLYVNATNPDTTLTVYPVPTQALTFHIISVSQLTAPPNLATELIFPPGYQRAFAYNLACELAPEFGVEPSSQVQRIAMTSKRNLKRINNPMDVMSMPVPLVVKNARFNVYTGNI